MEVRPIDANALNFEKLQDTNGKAVPMSDYIAYLSGAMAAEELIKNAPTLDFEPVVRCKDCKHSYFFDEKRYCNKVCIKSEFGALYCPLVEENHYCSYGAKMDEEVKE